MLRQSTNLCTRVLGSMRYIPNTMRAFFGLFVSAVSVRGVLLEIFAKACFSQNPWVRSVGWDAIPLPDDVSKIVLNETERGRVTSRIMYGVCARHVGWRAHTIGVALPVPSCYIFAWEAFSGGSQKYEY